jgi:hypothetical protein
MDPGEKQLLLESLESGRAALLAALADWPEGLAAQAPAAGRWSALECMEHVALVENNLFGRIAASERSETPVGSRALERRILQRGTDRTRPLEAPELARPSGRYTTLAAAQSAFVSSRTQTIRYVSACQEDLRARTADHPLLGPVNCYEMLLIMAIHPQRHVGQIEEIRAALAASR